MAEAATAVVDSHKANRRITVKGQATVADGIAVGTPGRITLPLVSRYVDDMVVVEEEEITQAMMLLLERCKLLVEGAGAVGLAAVLAGKRMAVVLSGGNVDTNLIARVLEHGLGRVHTKRSASKMSANEMNPRKITSSFSKREKMRRNPFNRRNSLSISLRLLYISRSYSHG